MLIFETICLSKGEAHKEHQKQLTFAWFGSKIQFGDVINANIASSPVPPMVQYFTYLYITTGV
jgi:hypothetical protein